MRIGTSHKKGNCGNLDCLNKKNACSNPAGVKTNKERPSRATYGEQKKIVEETADSISKPTQRIENDRRRCSNIKKPKNGGKKNQKKGKISESSSIYLWLRRKEKPARRETPSCASQLGIKK